VFVSEVDESDGSIALYRPSVAVLGNITLDHKSLDELRGLFFDFVGKARTAILNLDDEETRLLSDRVSREKLVTFSFRNSAADLIGANVVEEPLAISFLATDRRSGEHAEIHLQVPGRHNAQNALAAIAAVQAAGVNLESAASALSGFTGLRRRFEVIGSAAGVSVIDDFGHNPDKITATLRTLHAFPGRLLIFFQPHGFGPLKAMKDELIACFAEEMQGKDVLLLCDPVYLGGTVDRAVGSSDIVEGVRAAGREAEYIPARADCASRLVEVARPGDRIIIMGARDDTLSLFAEQVLSGIREMQALPATA
jgi:UDP-N-acetylmuramate--alanine ligase